MSGRLGSGRADDMRATWSTCDRTPSRFTGVIKEVGTDAWLWGCERVLHHAHETRKEAIGCARARIAEVARGEGAR